MDVHAGCSPDLFPAHPSLFGTRRQTLWTASPRRPGFHVGCSMALLAGDGAGREGEQDTCYPLTTLCPWNGSGPSVPGLWQLPFPPGPERRRLPTVRLWVPRHPFEISHLYLWSFDWTQAVGLAVQPVPAGAPMDRWGRAHLERQKVCEGKEAEGEQRLSRFCRGMTCPVSLSEDRCICSPHLVLPAAVECRSHSGLPATFLVLTLHVPRAWTPQSQEDGHRWYPRMESPRIATWGIQEPRHSGRWPNVPVGLGSVG